MSHIHRNALLPFSAEQMFQLVNDVQQYPEYLAGCVDAQIHAQSDKAMTASLRLQKHGISLAFTTQNTLDAPHSIVMALEDGPFDEFEGRWYFQRLDEKACKVLLDLRFSLSSKLSSAAAGKVLDSVGNNMVDAMVKRAKQIYG